MAPTESLPEPRWRLYAILGAVHLGVLLWFVGNRASGTASSVNGLPLDDAWIHLVYARSLAHGQGLAYNPGQYETGFTSPLWVLLLAPGFWLTDGAHAVWMAKAIGVALAFAGSVLAFRLSFALTRRRTVAWAAALLYALDPSLGFARLSGMEVVLTTVLLLWTMLRLVEKRPLAAAAGLGLLPLARPECALLVGLALPILVGQLRAATGRERLLAPLLLIAGGTAWMVWDLAVTGHPLPATFYAKHNASGLAAFADLPVVGRMILRLPWFAWGTGVALFLVGARALVAARSPVGILIVVGAIAMPLATSWAHQLNDDWPFYWNRYFMPWIPLLYLPIAVAVGETVEWARARRWALAAPGAALLLAGCAAWPRQMRFEAALLSRNCQDTDELQVALGKFIAAHAAPDDLVAANDAGAIRFFGGRTTIDLMGLNDHEILFGNRHDVLARLKPRFYVVFPSWFPGITSDPRFEVVARAKVASYSLCNCRQDEMVVLQRRAGATTEPGR
jgi:hypothetical protein